MNNKFLLVDVVDLKAAVAATMVVDLKITAVAAITAVTTVVVAGTEWVPIGFGGSLS